MEHNPIVIHEDDAVLVINKPAGLVVHGDGRNEERTLADWILEQYPELVSVGEPWTNQKGVVIARPGIVHRLDRDTSGVMVIAKTTESFEYLKTQFQERRVKKTYRAFAYDSFKEEEGEIDRPISKSKNDFRKWSAQPGGRGAPREAHTAWRVLQEITRGSKAYTYLELIPTTGRTHQLRVHLKAIHHPIVCDSLYAPKKECALGFSRLALHAHTLCFSDLDENVHMYQAPLPHDFENALA